MYCQHCRLFVTLFLPEVDLFLPPELRLENKQKKIHCKYYQMANSKFVSSSFRRPKRKDGCAHYCTILFIIVIKQVKDVTIGEHAKTKSEPDELVYVVGV